MEYGGRVMARVWGLLFAWLMDAWALLDIFVADC